MEDSNVIKRLMEVNKFVPEPIRIDNVPLEWTRDPQGSKRVFQRPIPLSAPDEECFEEFPVRALGKGLQAEAEAGAHIIQCPVEMAAMTVLGAVSLAAQAHVDVVLPIGTGKIKPTSLYLVSVGKSGERKTAIDELVMASVAVRQAELFKLQKEEEKVYSDKYDVWAKQRKFILNNKKITREEQFAALIELGQEPPKPRFPKLLCSEPTYEGLCRMYEQGYPAIGLYTSEAGQFFGGHGLQDDARRRTISNLSTIWDGKDIDRVRATGLSVLKGKRLSIHLMGQPKMSSEVFSNEEFIDQGILSRILMSHPASTMGHRMQHKEEIPAKHLAAIESFDKALLELLRREPQTVPGTQELTPRPLHMSEDAITLWKRYADDVESEMGVGGEFEYMTGLAGKLPEHAARIAANLTIFYDFNAYTISDEMMSNGIKLGRYFAKQAVAKLAYAAKDQSKVKAQVLYDWMTNPEKWNEKYITTAVISTYGPNALRPKAEYEKAIKVLEENFWLEPVEAKFTNGVLKDLILVDGVGVRKAWKIITNEDE